jgi:flavin-dependent dehydrogenase
MSQSTYDVVIVGASIAGCSAAIFLSRQDLKVALIERSRDIDTYKKLCTHYIQPSATPTIERLDIAEDIEDAGGIRNQGSIWTRWGWIYPNDPNHVYGYNVRRQTLDPILRRRAATTPGVTLMLGTAVRELIFEGDRVVGIRAATQAKEVIELKGRLVVGADGRQSRVAELAQLPEKVTTNNRFGYFAHFRDLPLKFGTRTQIWFLDPDVAYIFPNEGGITLAAYMGTKEKLAAFKQDVSHNFYNLFAGLPDAPDLQQGDQITGFMGAFNHPIIDREAAGKGVALVGDAALASDPLWGVGCGWAFQSSEWLADSTAVALKNGSNKTLDNALKQYRKKHKSTLRSHQFLIADYASGRPFNPIERLMYSAAARDQELAQHVERFGGRLIGVSQFLNP